MSERLFSNVYLVVYIDITALSLFLSTKKGTLENYFTLTKNYNIFFVSINYF